MAGVTTLNSNFQNIVTLAAGATEVAAASNSNSLVAYRPVSGGHTTVGVTAYVGAASGAKRALGTGGSQRGQLAAYLRANPRKKKKNTPTPTAHLQLPRRCPQDSNKKRRSLGRLQGLAGRLAARRRLDPSGLAPTVLFAGTRNFSRVPAAMIAGGAIILQAVCPRCRQ